MQTIPGRLCYAARGLEPQPAVTADVRRLFVVRLQPLIESNRGAHLFASPANLIVSSPLLACSPLPAHRYLASTNTRHHRRDSGGPPLRPGLWNANPRHGAR